MSISGEHSESSEDINVKLIEYLKNYGEVLTELFADPEYENTGETHLTDKEIHDRDMNWLLSSDLLVAEVSNTSFGVGYEIGRAVENNKKILCLRKKSNKRLSAMISGCDKLTLREYKDIEVAKREINDFINSL